MIAKGNDIANVPSMPQLVVIDHIEDSNELHGNLADMGNRQYTMLNRDQNEIVDKILSVSNVIDYNSSRCFYIDGPGGSGKMFVYTTLYNLLKSHNKNVCCMAFTGIAAMLLPKGMTVHKVLGLPVPLLSDSSSNIAVQSKEGQFLRHTDVFIWDETPMAPRYALEIMDRTLKDIMSNNLLFGGNIVILSRDFRQLLPILPRSIRSEVINLSIKSSILWNLFHKFQLTFNTRAIDVDISFSKFVLDVENGDLNDSNDNIDISERCITADSNFINSMYGHLIRNHLYDEMCSSVILAARNIDVIEINKTVV